MRFVYITIHVLIIGHWYFRSYYDLKQSGENMEKHTHPLEKYFYIKSANAQYINIRKGIYSQI